MDATQSARATIIARAGEPNPLAHARVREVPVRFVPGSPGPARIEWRSGATTDLSPPLHNVLWRFLALANAPDQDIHEFAKRFGPLGIGPDGRIRLSESGTAVGITERYWETPAPTRGASARDTVYWEPVSGWRYHARRLAARIALATDLAGGTPTRMEDWFEATKRIPATIPLAELAAALENPPDNAFAREILTASREGRRFWEPGQQATWLSHLVNDPDDMPIGIVRPVFQWDESGRRRVDLALDVSREETEGGTKPPHLVVGTFSAALQFTYMAALHSDWVFTCTICGNRYELPVNAKRPRQDRNHFCSEDCRRKALLASKRDSEKRRYQKRRHEGRDRLTSATGPMRSEDTDDPDDTEEVRER